MEPTVSFPPCPLWRWSAFLLDLSFHLMNLKLIFPSWIKVEEEQCFIKEFFFPAAATLFFIYIQRKSVYLFWENVFRNCHSENLIQLYPTPKKEEEGKEKMMTTTALLQHSREWRCVLISSQEQLAQMKLHQNVKHRHQGDWH